ncbi:MAG TPA: outer membrane beta-barrel protein, partial [Cytophagales bacterium]|nr:outer membrane beta-barrel protein [Cytophagales bacterium]
AYSYGTSKPFGQVNVAVQKQFMKGKASIKLAYSDIFWTHHYKNDATYNQLYTVSTYRWDNRVLMCTLNYRFGKRLDL